MVLTKNTRVSTAALHAAAPADGVSLASSAPVQNATRMPERDLDRSLSGEEDSSVISLAFLPLPAEQYELTAGENILTVSAGDSLGLVYGLLEISRRFLGVLPLWFWMDQPLQRQGSVEIPEGFRYASAPCAVRYRGWFINDEVLLAAWKPGGDGELPWRMAFEALLRLGGNLVIPGTDRNAHRYRELAASYGLIITHHHAEPLGAEMFARAYPDLEPSFRKHPELFRKLWREAVEEQKDTPTVYNAGFRGQGDKPFWADDPTWDTPEKRGKLISSLIREQMELVRSIVPGAPCCTNLYGEIAELYQGGYLSLPEDVIRIWADNGYGKMVSRRQVSHDPRVPSMPDGSPGEHGIYYHASFYDLQAASHITILPNPPGLVVPELEEVLRRGGNSMWIINCSNVKPHVFYLSLIAELWRNGHADPETFAQEYYSRYYDPAFHSVLWKFQQDFWDCAPAFGPEEDQHGGDQFPNYTVRGLVTQFHRDRNSPCPELAWACDATSFRGQLEHFLDLFQKAADRYSDLLKRVPGISDALNPKAAVLFGDTLVLQANVLLFCYKGAIRSIRAMQLALDGSYWDAFCNAGTARELFQDADRLMRSTERGKWEGFYANECLTDVRFTATVLEGLMAAIRAMGDGPEYWLWHQKVFSRPEDRGIVLLTNSKHRCSDRDLFHAVPDIADFRAAPSSHQSD